VDGIEVTPLARVFGDVFADGYHAIGAADSCGFGGIGERAVWSEGKGDDGTDQVDDPGTRGMEGGVEKELSGVVGRGEDDIGVEFLDLLFEKSAEEGVASEDTDFDSVEEEPDVGGVSGVGGAGASGELLEEGVVAFEAEFFDAGGDSDLVALGGEGFHQETIGFVASPEGGVVERIVG
jgi:hypothetical protein